MRKALAERWARALECFTHPCCVSFRRYRCECGFESKSMGWHHKHVVRQHSGDLALCSRNMSWRAFEKSFGEKRRAWVAENVPEDD